MQYLQWLKEHRNMFGLHIPCDITLVCTNVIDCLH